MSEWISVEDRLPNPNDNEVEIAYWDKTYMCRTFGAYDYDENAWYVAQEVLETDGFIITHWKYPTPLPEPPKEQGK